ncbi:MAG: ferredoxin [Patescibacteria group bacterium]
MKIEVDRDLCTGCGTCVALCPSCFKLDDENKSTVIGEGECAPKAESSCPEGAITVTD